MPTFLIILTIDPNIRVAVKNKAAERLHKEQCRRCWLLLKLIGNLESRVSDLEGYLASLLNRLKANIYF